MSLNGTLTITLKQGAFTRNCKIIRKMDPYVRFTYNGIVMESTVCEDGHKKPVWTD